MEHRDGTASRRALLGGAALTAPLVLAAGAGAQPAGPRAMRAASPLRAYVGSFTTAARRARGDGIHVYRIDPNSGAWTHLHHTGDLVNPSFLHLSRDQRFLYSVHGDEEYATAFAIDPGNGSLRLLGRAATGGKNGVRQNIDPTGRWMVVTNYSSGSVAVLEVKPDGSLVDQHQLIVLEGALGPHRVEQAISHPHDVVFDPTGRYVVVPDKGLDRIFVFTLDPATGRLSPTAQGSVQSRPQAGPRHCAFHPSRPVLWVLNELDSTLTTYAWDPATGALRPQQVITTLPTDFTGYSTCSEISASADGRFVYATNRGHDSITIFAVSPDGRLTLGGWQPSQGSTPRFATLAPGGKLFCAANEQSDTVVTYRVDLRNGRLAPTGQVVRNASPVTIVFAGG